MKRHVLVLLALLQLGAVFPPMVGGDFLFAYMQPCPTLDADGVPLSPPGLSIAFENMVTAEVLFCADTPLCDTRYEHSAKVTAAGQRSTFTARAFTSVACGGTQSDTSYEAHGSDGIAATYPGMKPKAAQLTD